MAECIDRVEYCEKHCRCSNEYCDRQSCPIWRAPAADVAPVVRCRDCKHFQHYGRTSLFIDGKHVKAGWCTRRILYDEEYRMLPDDFCSCGRRREGSDAQD